MYWYGLVSNNLFIILVYVAFLIGIKKFKSEKLSEIDFHKYKDYYRDILKDYSPAELSYIDNFEIDLKSDIIALLLSLKLKNKVNLKDKIYINSTNLDDVSSSEKYILDNIIDGKIQNIDEDIFINKAQKDAVKSGLLNEININWKKIIILFGLILIFMMLILPILIISIDVVSKDISKEKIIALVIFAVLIISVPFFLITYLCTYINKSKNNKYIRTSDGEEINKNLEGLKNYLNEYSLMNKRDESEIGLWEDYLIYSVLFHQNTKIVKDLWNKYVD